MPLPALVLAAPSKTCPQPHDGDVFPDARPTELMPAFEKAAKDVPSAMLVGRRAEGEVIPDVQVRIKERGRMVEDGGEGEGLEMCSR